MDQKEKEFLANYDMNKFERPTGYTSDIVIFTLTKKENSDKDSVHVLLVKRKDYPEKGKWALPGGFVELGEDAFDGAIRELYEETGVSDVFVKHFGVYDEHGRDSRGNGWVISNAHYAIVNEKFLERRKAGSDAEEVKLFSLEDLDTIELAFDHAKIINDAFNQVKKDVLETTVAKEFLEKEFTLAELYDVLKIITDFKLLKTNFFLKASKLAFIEEVVDEEGYLKTSQRSSKRPAQLYRFNDKEILPSIY